MKFVCDSSKLLKAVAIAERAVPARTSAQILENLHLALRGNTLVLRGYDMEIGIEYRMPVNEVFEPGEVLVKAKTLVSILAKLPHQEITVEVNTSQKMKITGSKIDFDILCLGTSDYPLLPDIMQGQSLRIPALELKSLIYHTIFSVSTDESRKFLNGVLLKVEDGVLSFVSTDGYRLAIRNIKLDSPFQDTKVIIPSKTITEMYKVVQQSDPEQLIEIAVSERQVAFLMPSFLMVSRVLDGKFPDYKQLIPEQFEYEFIISRRLFLDACERAHIISSFSHNVVRLTFSDTDLEITANASSFGDFSESVLMARLGGSELVKIAFNVKLVMDALRNMEADDVRVRVNHSTSPCLFEPQNTSDYFYVIMPIRTNDYQSPVATPAATVGATVVSEPEVKQPVSGIILNPSYQNYNDSAETSDTAITPEPSITF